ncbi:glycosyltransferase [candidate division WWE3 bacterium]|uniref:Glycosyltransferase n=1 Tax=candidate division WWE3 bacterium TaxID=2053526 RepID=A0A955LWB4_UNCKA|nr:glycosyltransferase [candidate division WWE3 bacterium]
MIEVETKSASNSSMAELPPELNESSPEILVSVFCQTYNHEPYISGALDGIIAQHTDFRYEIIVHDDASTDKTAAIIRDYAARYPSLFRVILQEENQYSKGGFKPIWYATRCAKGAYIALCEGDDQWIDNRKLQTQVDALVRHKNLDICIHPAALFKSDRDTNNLYGYHGNTELVVSPQHMIGGAVVPTASIMASTHVFCSLPDWYFSDAPVGDYYLRVIASAPNGALYIPKTMCIYRAHNPGSWSALVNSDPRKFLRNNERHLAVCNILDAHLERRYSSEIAQFRSRLLIGRMAVLFKIRAIHDLFTDTKLLLKDPISCIRTLVYISKLVGRKPVQSWQTISRNFSYTWTTKDKDGTKKS